MLLFTASLRAELETKAEIEILGFVVLVVVVVWTGLDGRWVLVLGGTHGA
jgi:hypothetical protein